MYVKASGKSIRKAAEIVRRGGLVVYPTDTVYGLGCDPFNIDAVQKIKNVKRRGNNPLPILAHNIESVETVTILNYKAKEVIKEIWPGPITLILPKKGLHDSVTSGSNRVGIRIPNNQVALDLVKLCGGLLIGTSANLSGTTSSVTAVDANKQIGSEVDLVLDDGPTDLKKESTIISLINDKIKIMREGAISSRKIIEMFRNKMVIES